MADAAAGTTVTFVTSNPGKFAIASEHLAPYGIDLVRATLDLDEIQSTSVHEVALHKAQQAHRILRRPLMIEDSGFYIDELNGFPGPLVKALLSSIGAAGIARLADMTAARTCHFVGVLVYIDGGGVPRAFVDEGDGGTVASEATRGGEAAAWSALWDVFVPRGCSAPLSALPASERDAVFRRWSKSSVFSRFGVWHRRECAAI